MLFRSLFPLCAVHAHPDNTAAIVDKPAVKAVSYTHLQQKYERELADYYTQLEQKGNAYNTAYTQDYGRYQDYLVQLDSLYGYYAAQEQQEAARRQQGFNNVVTVRCV